MTVSSNGTPARAAGNGVSTVYNFSMKIFADTDLVVRDILDATGVPTTKTLVTDYSVTTSTTGEGGSVTFTVAPAAGHTIDIRTVIPLTQPADIRNQGRFLPEIHENEFDRLERQIQDTRRLADSAIHFPDYEVARDMSLAKKADIVGKFLGIDASGLPIGLSGTGNDSALRTDLAVTTSGSDGSRLVGYRRTDTGAVAESVATVLRRLVWPEDFGAIGDGTTDDSVAVQAAITALAAGQTLMLNGDYKITGAGLNITNKTHLAFRGVGRLRLVGAAVDAIILKLVGTCDDIVVDGIRFEGDGNAGATYTQYGVGNLSGQTLSNIRVQNCNFKNLNAAISFNADSAGSYENCFALNNVIDTMVGVLGGQGYGVHFAGAKNVHIRGNVIRRCQRHSIYGARGSPNPGIDFGAFIHDNIIRDHKLGVAGTARPAIFCARGRGYSIRNNKIIDYWDGAIGVQQDTPTADNIGDCIIDGNEMFGRQNAVPSLWVGEQSNPTLYRISNVQVSNNTVRSDHAVGGNANEFTIYNGLGVQITDNKFFVTNIANISYRCIELGANAPQGALDITNVQVLRNSFNGSISGAGYSPVRFVFVTTNTATVPSGGAAVVRIADNEIDSTLLNLMAEFQAAQTNKKVVVKDQWGGITGVYTAADTAPDVYGGVTQLVVTNAGATNINTLANPVPGQRLTLVFTDGNTTLKHNTGNIRLIGGADIVGVARKTVMLEYALNYAQWLQIAVAANV